MEPEDALLCSEESGLEIIRRKDQYSPQHHKYC